MKQLQQLDEFKLSCLYILENNYTGNKNLFKVIGFRTPKNSTTKHHVCIEWCDDGTSANFFQDSFDNYSIYEISKEHNPEYYL